MKYIHMKRERERGFQKRMLILALNPWYVYMAGGGTLLKILLVSPEFFSSALLFNFKFPPRLHSLLASLP
jgi:hypothetical protein